MRIISICVATGMVFSLAARAGDGLTPRPSASDYAAQGQFDDVRIAAAILAPKDVSKTFSSEIARDYIVVEVAIYPGAPPFDVESSDFALRVGQRTGRADHPIDVVPWREKGDSAGRFPVDVSAETGVVYSRSSDPVNGTRQGVGTYTGVDVTSRGDNTPPPPPPGPDPRILDEKIRRLALPEEITKTPVAGYLYFPQHGAKRKKSDDVELKWSKDDAAVNLVFPKP
jgi:hypothetical protein